MREALEYPLGLATLRFVYGNINRINAHVLVNSDDVTLSMSGGASRLLVRSGGERVRAAARQAAPIGLGEVVATTAGNLNARRIFHAAVLDRARPRATTGELVRAVTRRCFAKCEELRHPSIALPPLASGFGLSPEESAVAVTSEAVAFLSRQTAVNLVVIALYPGTGAEAVLTRRFFNQAVEVLANCSPGA